MLLRISIVSSVDVTGAIGTSTGIDFDTPAKTTGSLIVGAIMYDTEVSFTLVNASSPADIPVLDPQADAKIITVAIGHTATFSHFLYGAFDAGNAARIADNANIITAYAPSFHPHIPRKAVYNVAVKKARTGPEIPIPSTDGKSNPTTLFSIPPPFAVYYTSSLIPTQRLSTYLRQEQLILRQF
jgi:hypothetical protein